MYKLSVFLKSLNLLTRFFYGFLFLARLKARYPSTIIETPNTIRFDSIEAITLGQGVSIGPYSEIVVMQNPTYSDIKGSLAIGDRVIIGMGANIRAAGGSICIGAGTMLAQYVSLIGANHQLGNHAFYIDQSLDTSKVGVTIGRNVWVGAGVIILPGVNIGDNSVIAAGALVSKSVPEGEIWGGIPASCIRVL